MDDPVHGLATRVIAWGAYLRGALVILLGLRTFLGRRRFAVLHIDRGFLLTAPEPALLVAATWILCARAEDAAGVGEAATAAALVGAALVVGGWLLILWTYASWPSIFVGHALLREHRLVTQGAYGVVRHPVYLGAFLIWLGLGVGFLSPAVLGIVILYVIPAYLLYVRDEEAMLEGAFGDGYRRYRQAVPRLVPRLGRGRRASVDRA